MRGISGISCFLTVCGFRFLDQSGANARVRGVTKSSAICYMLPFLRPSSSCEQLPYSRLVEIFSGKFSLSIFYYLLSLLSVSLTFSFDKTAFLIQYIVDSNSYGYKRHAYTPRFISGSFFHSSFYVITLNVTPRNLDWAFKIKEPAAIIWHALEGAECQKQSVITCMSCNLFVLTLLSCNLAGMIYRLALLC